MGTLNGQWDAFTRFIAVRSVRLAGHYGLSKTLRQELQGTGIKVVVLAPGNIAAEIWPKQTADLVERYANTTYYPELQRSLRHIGGETVKGAMTVEEFSEVFYRVLRHPEPNERYTVIKRRRHRLRRLSRFRVRVDKG